MWAISHRSPLKGPIDMVMSPATTRSRGWWSEDDCRRDDFVAAAARRTRPGGCPCAERGRGCEGARRLDGLVAVVDQQTNLDDYPFAEAVTENGLVSDCAALRAHLD